MDAIDWQILLQLQADGRLSGTELADRVGLSLTPCLRRIRNLEANGVINGYGANLDPDKLGLRFEALLFVDLQSSDGATVRDFENGITHVRSTTLVQRLFGQPDYLVRVMAEDRDDFQRIYDDELSELPGVHRITSTLVMKTVTDHPLPLPPNTEEHR